MQIKRVWKITCAHKHHPKEGNIYAPFYENGMATKAEVINLMLSAGWKLTQEGWRCPECLPKKCGRCEVLRKQQLARLNNEDA